MNRLHIDRQLALVVDNDRGRTSSAFGFARRPAANDDQAERRPAARPPISDDLQRRITRLAFTWQAAMAPVDLRRFSSYGAVVAHYAARMKDA